MRKIVALAAAGVLLAGCSSSTTPSAPSTPDAGYVCQQLTSTGVLADAQRATDADLHLADQLATVEQTAPTEMRAPFDNIIQALRSGGDLSIVGPDTRLLAGECRSRNLPIPTVT